MNNKIIIALVVIVLIAGGLFFMNKSSAPFVGNEIVMDGGEFFFKPATLSLKKGEKVRLVFNNRGNMMHDFVVDELNVKTDVIKGKEQTIIEFTPDKVGTFEFYCSVGQHRANGMKGVMTVQ